MCMEAAGRSREDSLPLLLPPSIEPIALCGLCCATANDNLQNLFQFPISFCCSFIGKWRISYLETLSVPIDLLANTQVYFHDWKFPNTDQKFWPSYFRNAIAYPFVDHMMNPEFWGRTKPSVWTPSSCKLETSASISKKSSPAGTVRQKPWSKQSVVSLNTNATFKHLGVHIISGQFIKFFTKQ